MNEYNILIISVILFPIIFGIFLIIYSKNLFLIKFLLLFKKNKFIYGDKNIDENSLPFLYEYKYIRCLGNDYMLLKLKYNNKTYTHIKEVYYSKLSYNVLKNVKNVTYLDDYGQNCNNLFIIFDNMITFIQEKLDTNNELNIILSKINKK